MISSFCWCSTCAYWTTPYGHCVPQAKGAQQGRLQIVCWLRECFRASPDDTPDLIRQRLPPANALPMRREGDRPGERRCTTTDWPSSNAGPDEPRPTKISHF